MHLTPERVANDLLAHLRAARGGDDVSFAEPPARVTGPLENSGFEFTFRLSSAPPELSGPLMVRVLLSWRGGPPRNSA